MFKKDSHEIGWQLQQIGQQQIKGNYNSEDEWWKSLFVELGI